MAQSCRLCRKPDDGFFESLFNFRAGQQIAEVVMKVCPIQIDFDDKLPKKICEECLEVSLSALQLQKTSIESDKFYRSEFITNDVIIKQEPSAAVFLKVEVEADAFNSGEESYASVISTRQDYEKPNKKTSFHPRVTPGSVLKPCQDIWYSCNFCDKSLKPRQNMLRHMMLLHDPVTKPFGCRFCVLRFEDETKKEIHESRSHVNDSAKILFCKICGASGERLDGMEHHETDDHKVDLATERLGNRSQDSSDVLEDVKVEWDDESQEESTASEASKHKSRKSKGKMPFHPRILPGSALKPCQERWYNCNFCDKKLKPRANMIRHMMLLHDPVSKPFACKFCILRFDKKKKRDRHQITHDDDLCRSKVFVCDVCGASGNNEEGMEHHRVDDHLRTEGKRSALDSSDEEEASNDSNHRESTSESSESDSEETKRTNKPRNKSFFHPRIAAGSVFKPVTEVWYNCNFCNKKLKPRNNMIRHMMLLHDPFSKPYGCSFCVQRFDNERKRDLHESTSHENMKPSILFCSICGVSGSLEEGMRHHLLDDHKITSSGTDHISIGSQSDRTEESQSRVDDGKSNALSENSGNDSRNSEKGGRRKSGTSFHPRITPGSEQSRVDDGKSNALSENSGNDSRNSEKGGRRKSGTSFHPRITPGSVLKPCQEIWYSCSFCDKSLKPRPNMIRHMMLLHDPQTKPFACKLCVLRFDNRRKKNYHESTAHEEDDELVPILFCDICGASGNNEKGMNHHKKEDHGPERRGRKRMKTSIGVKGNEDSTEDDADYFNNPNEMFNPRPLPGSASLKFSEIWFACNFCERKMKPRSSMLRHMKAHDPVRFPFACRYCIERFKTAEEWNDHEYEKHEGESGEPTIIVCDICGATGNNSQGMENHKADDHRQQPTELKGTTSFRPRPAQGSEGLEFSEVPFECNFCDKVLKPKNFLVQHMRAKHDPANKPFGCCYCVERFREETALTDHLATLHSSADTKTVYFCDLCGVSGNKKEGMRHHMLDDHLNITQKVEHEFKYNCTRCKAKFRRKQFLDNHLQFHHEENIKCPKCNETFSDRKRLNQHNLFAHDKMIRAIDPAEIQHEFKCCACSKEFKTEDEVNAHLTSHRQDYSSTSCQLNCTVQMKTFDSFVAHSNYHTKPKTHQCTKCLKIFPLDKKLYVHVAGHKRNEQPRHVKCEKCGSGFRSFKELDVHEKVKHQNQTLFICPFCAKSLASATILDTHIRFVHNRSKEEKFQCKICDRKFMRNTCLIRHSATHSTERPHVCQQCGASFKTKEGIAIHLKRHDGTFLKKFDCNQCSHKFTSRHRLQVHQLTHSGVKPYECQYCDRAYTSKGDLTKHLQKMHVGDAVYQCEKCPLAFPKVVDLREHLVVHAQNV